MVNLVNGRILFFADIHIDDYPNYNYGDPHARLNQYLDFANLIKEFVELHQAGTIILGGDTLNKGVNDPLIEHVCKQFLKIISNDGKVQVLHVLGQHDIKRKEQNLSTTSSFLNLFPEYTTYMGNCGRIDYTNPSGRLYKLAFRDWVPSEYADTFWSDDEKMDFFFAHVTNNPPFGQKIHNEKFYCGLFGDIHQQGEYDNMINLGTPFFHHRLDEEQNGRYAVIDLNMVVDDPGDCISFLPIDPTGKRFLKVKVINEELPEGKEYDPETKTFFMFIPKLTIQEDSQVKFSNESFELSNDGITKIINDTFAGTELQQIHATVLSNLTETPKPIDLNFSIVDLSIQNYRSIKNFTYKFGKTTAILGDHGSGKSTFINALKLALTLDKISEKNISHGETYAEINLRIAYQDHIYTLCSTSGTCAFAIDGEWQQIPAKQRPVLAKERMPFLNYVDVFMFTAGDRALLSAMNDDRKSEIISKIYNIDILNYLHDKAVELGYAIKQSQKEKESQKLGLQAVINHIKSLMTEEDLKLSISSIESSLSTKQAELNTLKSNQGLIKSYTSIRDQNKGKSDSIAKYESELTLKQENFKKIEINEASYKTSLKTSEDNLAELLNQRNLRKSQSWEYQSLMTEYKKVNEVKADWDSKVNDPSLNKCPTCGADLSPEKVEEIKKKLNESYEKWYNDLLNHYNAHLTSYNAVQATVKTYEKEEEYEAKLRTEIEEYRKKLEEISSERSVINKLNQLITAGKAEIDSASEQLALSKLTELGLDPNKDHSTEIETLSLEVGRLSNLLDNARTLESHLKTVANLEKEIQELNSSQDLYNRYAEACSNTSPLYQSILQVIASKFSNEQYKLVVSSYQYRGAMRLSIQMNYKVGKYWFEYPELSTAQQCFCDIYFLSNLLRGSGALILDEYFANVNSAAMIGVMETLKHLNVGALILSSHHDGLVVDGDILRFELINNESHITKL